MHSRHFIGSTQETMQMSMSKNKEEAPLNICSIFFQKREAKNKRYCIASQLMLSDLKPKIHGQNLQKKVVAIKNDADLVTWYLLM